VGICPFKESSKADIYLEFLNEKLFKIPEIKSNFIGIVHDGAPVLSNGEGGLITMLKENSENLPFFNLSDPCHIYSLAIRNSLGQLPETMTNFITKLHSHFVSPQRKKKLIRIQEQNGIKSPVVLKKYVENRWLILGQSIQRLLQLWDSLKDYMSENFQSEKEKSKKTQENSTKGKRKEAKEKELEALDYGTFLKLFSDEFFKMQIVFLNEIIARINASNAILQTKGLSIHELKQQTSLCYLRIAELIIKPNQFNFDASKIITQDLDNIKVREKVVMDQDEFIEAISNEMSNNNIVKKVHELRRIDQGKFYNTFKPFLVSILICLGKKLPILDETVVTLDFVQLKGDSNLIKKQMQSFNNQYKIIDNEALNNEFSNLVSEGISKYCFDNNFTILEMWDNIERSGYHNLALLAKVAQTLPTSSANIEQTFSEVKLFKTKQRNQLNERSLESLLIVNQELKLLPKFKVSDKLIELYTQVFSKKRVRDKDDEQIYLQESLIIPQLQPLFSDSQGLPTQINLQ